MDLKWRWDQGRLDYSRFTNIRNIAYALAELDNMSFDAENHIRATLMAYTGLPFKPAHYKVWRNYSRTFSCCFLAARVDNRLITTDVCRKLIESDPESRWEVDEYLSFLIPRFSYPFPAFSDFHISDNRIYPMCAIIKLLLARYKQLGDASITYEDVFSLLIGNRVTGYENEEFYLTLPVSNRKPIGDEGRQVRELMIFLSQASFLTWINSTLHIDIEDAGVLSTILKVATPVEMGLQTNADASVIALTTVDQHDIHVVGGVSRETHADLMFTEGKRVRTTHLRLERSAKLRNHFLQKEPRPILCDMCKVDNDKRYPWTKDLIEIHHLLPLASSLEIKRLKTSLNDIVALCPSCHRGVHVYYRNWLKNQQVDDFTNRAEAYNVYNEAKQQLWLG